MGEYDGRAVLVTGGALGIGKGIATSFAQAGAMVAVADTNESAARLLVDDLRQRGAHALATIGDVSSDADAERMVAETADAFGRLDVLVNNAGIHPMNSFHSVDELPADVWNRILSVNLGGAFLMAKNAIPIIRRSGRGCIVNMASVQGLQSMPRVAAYAASKGGLLSLTRSMAIDYAPEGIRVVSISPGTIDSVMVRGFARSEGDEEGSLQRFGRFHPLGRLGEPRDIAEAVLFLASDRASFITGENICVDGGLMALGAWASSAGGEP